MMSPPATASARPRAWSWTEVHMAGNDAGGEDPEQDDVEGQDGHGERHPDGDGGAGPGLEELEAGSGRRCRAAQQAAEGRAHEGEQVGNADQVAHHVVAVHTDEGEELVQHLELRDGDEDQQGGEVGGLVDAGGDEDGDDVEVQAAEIGAQPAPTVQPVGVGDVGVEDGQHEVDADTHDARPGASVAGRRCVPDLVEGAHGDADGDHRQEQVGVQDGLLDAARGCGSPGWRRSQTSRATKAARAAMTSGGQNNGRSAQEAPRWSRSGTTRVRNRRPSSNGLDRVRSSARSAWSVPMTPRGASLLSIR